MRHIRWPDYLAANGLADASDDDKILKLIEELAVERTPRVFLERFPENLYQAKFFVRNCKAPSHVFNMICSQDVCQERMLELGAGSPGYLSSGILAQKVNAYNAAAKEILPYLKEQVGEGFCAIDAEKTVAQILTEVRAAYEPTVIHIRPGPDTHDLKKEVTEQLQKCGFMNLDINSLNRLEAERKTAIGQEMHAMVQGSKTIPAEMIIRMLKMIVFNGDPRKNKFILTSFPDIIEQAGAFEAQCAKITSIFYTTRGDVVEIKNNALQLFNIESLFQKEFRLRTLREWNEAVFFEKLGRKTEFGICLGHDHVIDRKKLAEYVTANLGMVHIDFRAINDTVKASLGTEEEPFEGEVAPTPEIEKAAAAMIKASTGGKRQKYLLDGYSLIYKSPDDLLKFTSQFGVPEFVLDLTAPQAHIDKVFCASQEGKDAVDEEGDRPVLDELKAQDEAMRPVVIQRLAEEYGPARCRIVALSTDASEATTFGALKAAFQPKVILLNHEKRLGTDTACANLAIKYNLVYLSVYQVIRGHIDGQTAWGKKLAATKRHLKLNIATQMKDDFDEQSYSAALYDYGLVMQLLKETIAEKRTDEQFVLLEGLFNSAKLDDVDAALENRLMDEFQAIEREIGDVAAVVGLHDVEQPTALEPADIEWVRATEEEGAAEEQPKAGGEEGGEGEAGPPKPKFRAEAYDWSVSDRKPRNLPQVFLASKGAAKCRHEVKASDAYSASQYEATSKALDEFCMLARKEA
jgi:adenylate kinase family enzyme